MSDTQRDRERSLAAWPYVERALGARSAGGLKSAGARFARSQRWESGTPSTVRADARHDARVRALIDGRD